ncbi:MAG: Fur family transcriptional regulator [Dehalococcoidia bacterium]
MSNEPDIATLLRSAGQKVTPQRLLILTALRNSQGHVTASQILEKVKASYPYVDASTVYRTLAAAKELRLVSETNLGTGDNLFEWIGSERHHHLICRSCGSVAFLEERYVDELAERLEQETGFDADLEHLALFGTCEACKAKQTTSR